jgi:nucleotide-binding universal stress UspA family protein
MLLVATTVRILLAVDSSPYSAVATERFVERPWPTPTIVRVLSVAQFAAVPGETLFWDSGAINERLAQSSLLHAQELVERVAGPLQISGASIETTVRRGDPRTEIEDEAKDWKADLIVLGSHGRSGVRRWVLGSVAEHVVRHASCSVLVCR